jgi:Tfp pilus assembly protein PilF
MTSVLSRITIMSSIITAGLLTAAPGSVRASFERQEGSARSMGLEGAVAGFVEGCDAAFYNAGGLAQAGGMELTATFSRLYMGLSDSSNLSNGGLVFCSPIRRGEKDFGTWALSMNSFALQDYYSESEAGLFYGKKVDKKMSVGVGLRYLNIGYGSDEYTSINPVLSGQKSKSNISADLGIMAFPMKNVSLGLSVKDVNSPDMGIKYSDPVSQKVSLGGAYRLPNAAVVAGIQTQKDSLHFAFGGERWFMANRLGARAACGIGNKNYADIGAGFSYRSGKITIDYALNYPLSGISGTYGTHVMSFGYAFTSLATVPEISVEQKQRDEAAEAYNRALQMLKQNEYGAAAELSRQAAQLVPTNEKYKDLAERLMTVLPNATAVLDSKRAGADAARKGLKLYADGEDPQKAVELLIYAFTLDSGNDSSESMAKAIAKEEKLRVPDYTTGWNFAQQKLYVALERFKEKKYYECIRLCEEAVFLEPRSSVAYKRMGSAFYMLRNNAKARENWEKAIRYASDAADAQKTQQLIEELDKKGQPQNN